MSKTVVAADPYRHLCSIHGSTATYYEYWKPEFTHASIQDEAPVHDFGCAAILCNAYFKPIIYDEVGYEGNLPQCWGRYSGEEMPEYWLFKLSVKNSKYEKLKPGTRFKVEIIDTWCMTIQTYPLTFETGIVNDYRLYDKDLKKFWLPLQPYMALRITEILSHN